MTAQRRGTRGAYVAPDAPPGDPHSEPRPSVPREKIEKERRREKSKTPKKPPGKGKTKR